MDQEVRNKLRNVVTKCRNLLEESVRSELEGTFGLFAEKKGGKPTENVIIEDDTRMSKLSVEDKAARKDILDHFAHIKARSFKAKEALDQLVREIAFTHLNRFCAYKMMEARQVYIGDHKFREAVSRGVNSNGVKFYLAEHPDDERLFNTGKQDIAYRHFLNWLGGLLSDEIGVLFSPDDSANRLYPSQKVLDEVLDLINDLELAGIWVQDETIGWVYQYFTPKELRDQARKESEVPRNSYELAFRNQFFTPRYVVEFLTDNTLGRIWYEMRKGDTRLKSECRYLVRRPNEVFLAEGQQPPKGSAEGRDNLSQDKLLKLPVYIPHRPKKDPRDIKVLDPASGSGHFLLYGFDLLVTIYEDAYSDFDLGPALRKDFPTFADLQKAMPGLILAHNLHGIDIDLRASQIAAFALWLRCQKTYQNLGLKKDRPRIARSNFVCAEPMPGEDQMLKEFVSQLEPKLLGQLVEVVFQKMKLAGETGSLLRIEEEIKGAVTEAKRQFNMGGLPVQETLFDTPSTSGVKRFSVMDLTDAKFFQQAESGVIEALRNYAEKAHNGQRLKRRLFTEDAVRGFAFVDLCHKRFDVVLMNPPFGTATSAGAHYVEMVYPTWNKNLLCAFIERGLNFLSQFATMGAIFDRTAAIKSTYEDFRRTVFFASDRPRYCGDLGWEVLDANVETSTMVWHSHATTPCEAHFCDVRNIPSENKNTALLDLVRSSSSPSIAVIPVSALLLLPNAAMGYDMPRFFITLASHRKSLRDSDMQAYTGAQMRAEQHFRVFWECSLDQSFTPNSQYCYMYNGGEYGRYFLAPRDVALYGNDGQHVDVNDDTYSWRIQSKHAYFKSGVGFGVRGEYLDAHYLRQGYLFTVEGQSTPVEDEHRKLVLLGVLNSAPFQIAINSYCGQHKYSGYLNLFPCPDFDKPIAKTIAATVSKAVNSCEKWYSHDQTCLLFGGVPWMLITKGNSLAAGYDGYREKWRQHDEIMTDCFLKNDEMVVELLHVVEKAELKQIAALRGRLISTQGGSLTARDCVSDLLDYCVSVATGRWDVRLLEASQRAIGVAPEAYPSNSPARLLSDDGMHSCKAPLSYPILNVDRELLLDDQDHPADIVRCVRGILDVIWKDKSFSIEKEGCELLGVKELREYFRKPGNGGFWDDHISRYSKSRRKAPIYWLLQSSKRNFAIWLCYHRLDKDLLFKALVNYVEPKNRLETSRLAALRNQKSSVGESGKEAKRLATDIEKQEEFISELRDFEDKLRRAANLHLQPDLNDGVVLNIAPLHELVPWNIAKDYWNELLEGKYEWSSIGKQLRRKGMVK